jgi:ADP-ribose pyrophosphatase YjhB (NUDIX family)
MNHLPETALCYNDAGEVTAVPYAALQFRPAVYGLLLERGELLLIPHAETLGWRLPGGMMNPNETPEQALQARFREITGITPQIERLLLVDERYYLDENGQGWRLADMFFAVQRPSTRLDSMLATDYEPRPQWVELTNLQRPQMELGYAAVNLLKQDVT